MTTQEDRRSQIIPLNFQDDCLIVEYDEEFKWSWRTNNDTWYSRGTHFNSKEEAIKAAVEKVRNLVIKDIDESQKTIKDLNKVVDRLGDISYLATYH